MSVEKENLESVLKLIEAVADLNLQKNSWVNNESANTYEDTLSDLLEEITNILDAAEDHGLNAEQKEDLRGFLEKIHDFDTQFEEFMEPEKLVENEEWKQISKVANILLASLRPSN